MAFCILRFFNDIFWGEPDLISWIFITFADDLHQERANRFFVYESSRYETNGTDSGLV